MSGVRAAGLADLEAIGAMLGRFHREVPEARLIPFYPATALRGVAALIESRDGCVLVAGEPVAGMLIGAAQPSFWAPLLEAREVAFWVDREQRGRLGPALLEAWRSWARWRGAAVVAMSAFDDRAGRLYERRGFARVETTWAEVV